MNVVSVVETRDALGQLGEELLVPRHAFVGGVPPIGEQGEIEMALGIRQVVHLELLDRLFDALVAGEQPGYDDHGSHLGGHAASEVEFAEQPGWNDNRDQAMDQGHGDIGGGDEGENPQEDEDWYAHARAPGQEQRAGEKQGSEDGNQSEIAGCRMDAPRASNPDAHGEAVVQPLFERPPATRYQVVSRVLLSALGNGELRRRRFRWGGRRVQAGVRRGALAFAPGLAGQRHRLVRHVQFRPRRTTGQLLDGLPVLVARGEIHGSESGSRSEGLVHQTHALEKLRPADGRHPPHAGDDVPDGDVRRGLSLMHLTHDFALGSPLGGQGLVQPVEGRCDRQRLVTEPLQQLHGERTGQGGGAKTAQHIVRALRRSAAQAQQTIRHLICACAPLAGADDKLRQPSQVLQEGDAKVDRDCPEFTDAEGLDALVCPNESLERLHVEPTVGMGHIGPRQPIDARVSSEVVALGDLRQEPVKAAREVVPDLPDLPVHDVKVVEEPLLGLRNLTLLSNRLDDVPVPCEEHLPVFADTGEESPSFGAFMCGGLGRGQALGVLLEPLDAEHLGADRLFHARQRRDHGIDGLHVAFRARTSERAHLAGARRRVSAAPAPQSGCVHLVGCEGMVIHRIRLLGILLHSASGSGTRVN
jgi:hypothetical protein